MVQHCSGHGGLSLSLLAPTYKVLSNILLSRLTPYVDKISGDRQRGFASYVSTTDHVYTVFIKCLRQVGIQWSSTSTACRFMIQCWSELMFVIIPAVSLVHLLVAARSKAWVCGRSLAGIVGSNPVGVYGCFSPVSVVCCQVEVYSTD